MTTTHDKTGSAITLLSEAANAFCEMPARSECEAIYALQAAHQMVESCTEMEVSTRLTVMEALDNEIARCDMDWQQAKREAAEAREALRWRDRTEFDAQHYAQKARAMGVM